MHACHVKRQLLWQHLEVYQQNVRGSQITKLKALCHDINGDCYYFRSSIRTHIVINRAHTKISLRTPCGLQNAIKGRSKYLAICGTARGLVSLSASQPTLTR